MRGRRAAFLVLLALLLAGCSRGPGGSTSPTWSSGPAPVAFDGNAAHAFVAEAVTAADGSPAFRVPGTPAHREAAQRLHAALQAPGWTAAWQNFTGADYAALDKGAVADYHDDPSFCDAEERRRLGNLTFSNLVATRPGAEPRTLVLGAHWDSKRFASSDPDPARRGEPVLGANDGASGVGVLLQLMRELDGAGLPFTVQAVLFDGEDGFEDCHPLAGSLWFVRAWQEAQAAAGTPAPLAMGGGRHRMLLLDMVGDPDARFVREQRSVRCDPGLVDLLWAKAPAHGLRENMGQGGAAVHDDHVPFAEAGIPAVDLIDLGRGFPPYWHTTHDTLDKVDAGMLGRVGALIEDVLRDPAFSAPWPEGCR